MKDGDSDAIGQLFQQFYNDLYSYGLRLSNNSDLTHDSIQELFTRIWNSREHLSDLNNPKMYFLKSLHRIIMKELVFSRQEVNLENTDNQNSLISFSPEDFIIDNEHQKETTIHLSQIMNQLSERQREIIYLRFYQSMDYDEIAEITGLNYQSVRNLMYKAMKSLRKKLQDKTNNAFGLYLLITNIRK